MDMKTIGIVVMVVALAFTIYMEVQKRTTFAKLEAYLREGDLENYLKVLDRPLTNVLYPKYNVLFMRLNALLAMDDAEKTAAVIREMGSLKMNDEQRIALAVKAFTFYVEIEDELHAREVLEYLEANGDESMAKANRRTYDIFLRGSHAYIDEMESALSDASGVEEALLCQMLAIQYDNKGDKDRSASYRERAEHSLDAVVSK
ncbi:MAG: hypothetical protein KH279_02330 [Collinsella intestinalis]|nr:hypothetical protein [Collinsella intestinalis]